MPPSASKATLRPDEPVVQVEGLNFCFRAGGGWIHTLKDINLSVMPGELVILSGPSGCGKTTLLTLLGGLRAMHDQPISVVDPAGGEARDVAPGDIRIWDRDDCEYRSLRGLDEAGLVQVRRSIGFIFQRHNLLESLTATENIRMAQDLLARTASGGSDPTAEATDMLKYLMLGHRARYKAQGLSGGQRQRVAIARALINSPQLVLADEPTAALDEVSGERVITLLQHLARADRGVPDRVGQDEEAKRLLGRLTERKGCTSLIVTHDSRIMNEADRIVEMDRGEIKVNVVVAERMFLYESLRKCPAFAAALPDRLIRLADRYSIGLAPTVPISDERARTLGRLQVFQPGEVLLRQGEATGPESRCYLIRTGRVQVRQDLGAGERVFPLVPGQFVGDRAIIKYDARNATAVALDRVVCYQFPFGELRESPELNWVTAELYVRKVIEVYGVELPQSRPDSPPPGG